MTLAVPTLEIPDMSWPVVQSRIAQFWQAREAPHISILAKTRAGKSYLLTRGLLPLAQNERVLFIDFKGNDRTLSGYGKPVRQIPPKAMRLRSIIQKPSPEEYWYRLVIHKGPQNVDAARAQVARALDRVFHEGDWVVLIDELRPITDPQPPCLKLKPYYEELILRGGSNGIASASASQEPRWLPGCFYTQANFYFFSRIEDQATQKRIAEVGSVKALLPHIQAIPNRRWIYMDDMEESGERFWGRTKVE